MRRPDSLPVPRPGAALCLLPVFAICLLMASPAWASPLPGFHPVRKQVQVLEIGWRSAGPRNWVFPFHRSHSVRKHIESLEMEWRNAELHNDVKVMSRLLADDYLGISANGTVITKSEEIAQHRAGTIRIKSLVINDLKVRVYSGTAVVTSQAEVVGLNGQSNISGDYRYTRVYAKRLGKWKIVSFEASRIHDIDARKTKVQIEPSRH